MHSRWGKWKKKWFLRILFIYNDYVDIYEALWRYLWYWSLSTEDFARSGLLTQLMKKNDKELFYNLFFFKFQGKNKFILPCNECIISSTFAFTSEDSRLWLVKSSSVFLLSVKSSDISLQMAAACEVSSCAIEYQR